MGTATVIYKRVSDIKQEVGYSLDFQERDCRAYAAARGLDVIRVYSDSVSAIGLRERREMLRLLEDARSGQFEHLIVWKLDRLSRDQEHQMYIRVALQLCDVTIHSTLERMDTGEDDIGSLVQFIAGWQGKREHRDTKLRTTEGKLARIHSGKLIPGGKPLYGYRWDDPAPKAKGALIINPDEAEVVRRIYRLLTTGWTLRRIAIQLTADGVPTPTGRSSRWVAETLRNILHNPSYKGDAYGWGLKRSKPGQPRFDPERAIALPAGTIPRIVDDATWHAAQEILTRNHERATRNTRDPEASLLRGGFARCGYCGRNMRVRRRASGAYEYICNTDTQAVRTCERPTITVVKLDELVWSRIRHALLNDGVIEAEVRRMQGSDPTSTERAELVRSLAAIDRQRENLVRAIGLTDDPDASALLVAQLGEITTRRKAALAMQDTLSRQHGTWQTSQAQLTGLDAWRARVSVNIDTLTWSERRQLLDLLQVKVDVFRATHDPRLRITSLLSPALLDCDQYDKSYWSQSPGIRLSWEEPGELDGPFAWSRRFAACVVCGGIDHPHAAKGECSRCYQRLYSRTRDR